MQQVAIYKSEGFFSRTKQLGKMRKEDGSQVWFPSTHAGQLMPVFLASGHLMPSAGLQRCLHIDVHTPALTERHTHKYISIKNYLPLTIIVVVFNISFENHILRNNRKKTR